MGTTKKCESHKTYGGLIHNSDFDCIATPSYVASKIVSDWKFDKKCKENMKCRNMKNALENIKKK